MSRSHVSAETLRRLLDYDPDTGSFIWKTRDARDASNHNSWNVRYAGKPAFTHSDYGSYLRASIFGSFYSAHRVAWAIVHGDPVPDFIDHIDGDRQNNRIANLRSTDKSGNSKNRGIRNDNTTGRCGVHLTKSGTYKARIFVHGRDKYIGTYKTFQEAVRMRREAEQEFGFSSGHGERQGVSYGIVPKDTKGAAA